MGAYSHVSGELGGHGADAHSAIDDDECLLLQAAEWDKVEVAHKHLLHREPDEGQRRGLAIGPAAVLAACNARVDGGVLGIRARAAEYTHKDDLVAHLEQGVCASLGNGS